jgi:hypothetical protein
MMHQLRSNEQLVQLAFLKTASTTEATASPAENVDGRSPKIQKLADQSMLCCGSEPQRCVFPLRHRSNFPKPLALAARGATLLLSIAAELS